MHQHMFNLDATYIQQGIYNTCATTTTQHHIDTTTYTQQHLYNNMCTTSNSQHIYNNVYTTCIQQINTIYPTTNIQQHKSNNTHNIIHNSLYKTTSIDKRIYNIYTTTYLQPQHLSCTRYKYNTLQTSTCIVYKDNTYNTTNIQAQTYENIYTTTTYIQQQIYNDIYNDTQTTTCIQQHHLHRHIYNNISTTHIQLAYTIKSTTYKHQPKQCGYTTHMQHVYNNM